MRASWNSASRSPVMPPSVRSIDPIAAQEEA